MGYWTTTIAVMLLPFRIFISDLTSKIQRRSPLLDLETKCLKVSPRIVLLLVLSYCCKARLCFGLSKEAEVFRDIRVRVIISRVASHISTDFEPRIIPIHFRKSTFYCHSIEFELEIFVIFLSSETVYRRCIFTSRTCRYISYIINIGHGCY